MFETSESEYIYDSYNLNSNNIYSTTLPINSIQNIIFDNSPTDIKFGYENYRKKLLILILK